MRLYQTSEDVLSENWYKNPRLKRGAGGVYRITDKGTGELLYIGQSNNVFQRLMPSTHPVYDRDLHDVYVLFEDDKQERRYKECRFIEILKPPKNERRGLHTEYPDDLKRAYYDLIFPKQA